MIIYIRNRQKYSLNCKYNNLPSVTVEERRAGRTFIADIKEEIKRQGILRADEIFQLCKENGRSFARRLEDGRTVAHYRIRNEEILETCTNPFFASCMYILQAESKLIMEMHENEGNDFMARKLEQSVIHKTTIIQVLFNCNKQWGDTQPEHLETVEEFIRFVRAHPKKGCEMSAITVKNVWAMYNDYIETDLMMADPIASLTRRYKDRMSMVEGQGDLNDDVEDHPPRPPPRRRARAPAARPAQRKKAARQCEHCDEREAVFYCAQCQKGLVLCQQCCDFYHVRIQHDVQDVKEAPKVPRPYVPQPYRAPYALLGGLAFGAVPQDNPILSMTEDELRVYAQKLTDTDLSDRSPGKKFGGFDSVESLISKGLITREATGNPTYSLTESGHELGRTLLKFHQAFLNFCGEHYIPKEPSEEQEERYLTHGNRHLCLLIDEQEKSKERMMLFAQEKNISAQIRPLPAGDYMWILSPPGAPQGQYQDRQPERELVLPVTVERKTWDDLNTSMKDTRFIKQMKRMVKSGLKDKFFLIEGNMGDMVTKPKEERKLFIKEQLQQIQVGAGFFVTYTASWFKTAKWILYLSYTIGNALEDGIYGNLPSLAEVTRKVNSRATAFVEPTPQFVSLNPFSQVWKAGDVTDALFGIEAGEHRPGDVFDRLKRRLGREKREDTSRFLLVLQGLEEYNKERNKCLHTALGTYLQECKRGRVASDVVRECIGHQLHKLVHYDVHSYWTTKLKIFLGITVIRTEAADDTANLQAAFIDAANREHFLLGRRGNLPPGQQIHQYLTANNGQLAAHDPNHDITDLGAQTSSAREEDDMNIAIQLSLQDIQQPVPVDPEIDDQQPLIIDPEMDEDYDFLKVLERSKQDKGPQPVSGASSQGRAETSVVDVKVKTEPRDDLMADVPPMKKPRTSDDVAVDEDDELARVLELSRQESSDTASIVDCNRNTSMPFKIKEEPVGSFEQVPTNEEEQLRYAINLSLRCAADTVQVKEEKVEIKKEMLLDIRKKKKVPTATLR